jgi:putative tryptophan/tyrosine transport system substrate-binding protein
MFQRGLASTAGTTPDGARLSSAVYPFRYWATQEGLAVYGVDLMYHYRRAASYVDRIRRGTNPADLPVQVPDKFELIINLKAAKSIGIEIPTMLLARADEAIE